MNNTKKSWKGAPTTNLLSYSNQFEMWSSAGVAVVSNTTLAPDGTMTADSASNTPSAGSYLYPGAGTTAYIVSTQYTRSIYAKAGVGTGILVYEWLANGSGTFNLLTGTASGTGASIISVGNGWYRCICTATYTGTGGGNAWYIGAYGSTVTATTLYLWGAQVEISPFVTPLVITTTAPTSRSNTQAVLDLTGNNTLTATSLTYVADNTFSFNGSADNFAATTFNYNFNGSFSLMVWVNLTTVAGSQDFISNYNDVDDGLFFESSGSYLRGVYRKSGTGDIFNFTQPSDALIANTWNCVCLTYDQVTCKIYKNGVQLSTTASATAIFACAKQSLEFGRISAGLGRYLSGSMPCAAVYNKALTAAEVAQNFQALRGRYGI